MTCPVLIVSTRTTSKPCMTSTSRLTTTGCDRVTEPEWAIHGSKTGHRRRPRRRLHWTYEGRALIRRESIPACNRPAPRSGFWTPYELWPERPRQPAFIFIETHGPRRVEL